LADLYLQELRETMIENQEEIKYLRLLAEILNGSERTDRTGIGTHGIFGSQLRFSLADNKVPMLTTKKMFSKGIIEELLFFLRGETDTKKLEAKGVNIWKGNTTREFLDKRGLDELSEGDMGKGYGFQWRNFGGKIISNKYDASRPSPQNRYADGVDQLSLVINTLKTNPTDRRIIMSAWNPKQLPEMALPPCHMMVQFYADGDQLSSQFYMRSVDSFLGLPFNILSYAILTRIVAETVGMKAKEVIFVGGDTHVYKNHIPQVLQQIMRDPFDFPTMDIKKSLSSVKDIENLTLEDFQFNNYQSHPAIKAEMAI
jgi:thymidylate synthase